MPSGFIKSVDQVGIVVRDLDAAMALYSEDLGLGPWSVFTISPETCTGGMSFRDEQQPHSFAMAICDVGTVTYELIQPLDGPSSYTEFLDAHGDGFHHVGFVVDDIDAAIAQMEAKGYSIVQSGRGFGTQGDGHYVYFETDAAIGYLVEAIQMPESMREPERTVA